MVLSIIVLLEKMITEKLERKKSRFLNIAGYLIPLIQSLPPLGIWTGLMTLPFASYLLVMFTNLPLNLYRALVEFSAPHLIPEKAFIIAGLLILLYSTVYQISKKKDGLVTSGPYRLIRHPQYLGIILTTLGLTSWSVWILNNTFGIGFLNPSQTILVWFIELFAYILLAYLEEHHLSSNYGEAFKDYKRQVPFLIPYLKNNRDGLEICVSILIPTMLLFGLIVLHSNIPFLL
jgi:protein-S-isoprenylcysteine O-methyltransferase Ste14